MLSSGVQPSFARMENKAPLSGFCPSPTACPPPRILWAVARLERLGLNFRGDWVGGGKWVRIAGTRKKRALARVIA